MKQTGATRDFRSFLADWFGCPDDVEIKIAAARFILGLAGPKPPGLGAQHVAGYALVDSLLEQAEGRFRVQVQRVGESDSSHLGRLYTCPGGFILKIRQDISRTTFRLVRAHEFAHILVYDRTRYQPARYFPNSPQEERWCDDIARHILLPEELVKVRLAEVANKIALRSFDALPGDLMSLCDEWLVTPWQMIRRLLEPQRDSAVVAVLWRKELSQDVLKIVDRISPSGIYVPLKDRSFPSHAANQLAWRSIRTGRLVFDEDMVELGTLRGTLPSVAFSASRFARFVVQLIYLDSVHMQKSARWKAAHAPLRAYAAH